MELISLLEVAEWLFKKIRPGKVLLAVEDNVDDRDLLVEELKLLKIKYDTAKTAEEASGLLHKTKYSWALIDIGLPHKSGGTLAEEVHDKYPETQVWLVTGARSVELIPGKEMRIISKPITAEVLRSMII